MPLLENIQDQILRKGCMLYDEVPFLLREEVRDPRVYQAILAANAAGARRFSELSSKTGLDKAHLTRYLAILADLGIIEREVPVTEARPEKSRRGLYRIADPFVSFWYRFVFPNRDQLELGEAEQVLRREVKPALDEYISRTVEPHLGTLFRTRWRHYIPFEPAFMGRYWDDQREIDWLVLDRDRERAVAVEIKWSRTPVLAARLADDLRNKLRALPGLRPDQCELVLVSRSGFREGRSVPGCTLLSLNAEPSATPHPEKTKHAGNSRT
jgi:AAA+ ATPase superfamily predicted ATPase